MCSREAGINKVITPKSLTIDEKRNRETGGKLSESSRGKEACGGKGHADSAQQVFLHETQIIPEDFRKMFLLLSILGRVRHQGTTPKIYDL